MTQTAPTLPLTVDEAAVRAALPSLDVLGTLRSMFASLAAARAVQPPQTLTLFPEQAMSEQAGTWRSAFEDHLARTVQSVVVACKLE